MTLPNTPNARILVVDDDEHELGLCAAALGETGDAQVVREAKSTRAATLLGSESFDLLVTDLRMPVVDGIALLQIAHSHDPELPVVILTGHPSVDTAVETLKLGAADYLTKPVNVEELVTVVRRLLEGRRLRGEHRLLERRMDRDYAFDEIVGSSTSMQRVFETVTRLSESNVDVLIVGDTGTGKELVARSIHKRSRDRKGRFVPVDCAAIPDNLLESELFGHERGAFSGAHARSIGLMEFADSGTLFLDEVNSLPLSLQAKLLRALQERTFRRVGATQEVSVNIRVVAAANRDLAELVRAERFREDLYYRLNVGRVELPPLRERGDDILRLAVHFVERFAKEMGKPATVFSPDAMEVLAAYSWPGNVRELQNVIKRTLVMTQRKTITPDELPDEIVTKAGTRHGVRAGTFFELRAATTAQFEREYLKNALTSCDGDVSAAAKKAGVPRGTLYRLMAKHNLTASEFRSDS